ncbi:hypothetical protein [Desnuesiella massiliensis]|uniref:hypothetical protein n=1 Tax=Desnuesiella massiliensis TaxID=1650662 RepID=UPI0006E38BE4|nr:hypothetical protein [Desnuesiella massiliensis]
MNRNDRFVNFILACIPGVGYMYNGLLLKGLELLGIFIMAPVILDFAALDELTPVIMVPLWFYGFFDTFNVARRREAGEVIQDRGFILGNNRAFNGQLQDNSMKFIGILLIILGILSLTNRILRTMNLMFIVKSYLIPIFFILLGIYIIFKDKINGSINK